jgi:hypothetical protein
MLSPASNRRTHPTSDLEQFDPALRFECWTLAKAIRLAAQVADIKDGVVAGRDGAPCPGPGFTDAYRLGWEMGAIAVYRVPVPAWMLAVNKQAAQLDRGCAGSA